MGQAVDWFRARRLYDPELLAFVDLDAELLLRLHREDMRVTRNILVAWGGPATHAVPAPGARSCVGDRSCRSRRARIDLTSKLTTQVRWEGVSPSIDFSHFSR